MLSYSKIFFREACTFLGRHLCESYCNVLSEFPLLAYSALSCSTTKQPGKLKENILQNIPSKFHLLDCTYLRSLKKQAKLPKFCIIVNTKFIYLTHFQWQTIVFGHCIHGFWSCSPRSQPLFCSTPH